MNNAIAAIATSLTLLAAPASAAVVLFDDFSGYGPNSATPASDSVFNGVWKTTSGSVDYLASGGNFGYLCPTGTNCIDLDGSSNAGGVFQTVQTFGAGIYNILFQLAGNNRGATDDTVTITFGRFVQSITLASSQVASQMDYGNLYFNIVVTAPTTLSFANAGNDNQGALLKSVVVEKVAPIPVPAAGWLLALGLGALAMVLRKKLAAD